MTTSAASGTGRSALRRYLPPQHGAWAMLALPFLVGVACTRPAWLHLPLLLAWLGGYLLSYYALLALKTRHPRRVAPQLRLYATVTLPAALAVVIAQPAVLWSAPAFAVLLGVNAVAARNRDDRSLSGGLASVLQSCLMVPLAAVVAGVPPQDVALPALAVLAYFTGSLLYVKTMIRNRGDARYLRASIAFHALAVVGAAVVAWPLAIPFGWLLARAAWLPRLDLTPKQVGLVEVVNSLALLVMIPAVLAG